MSVLKRNVAIVLSGIAVGGLGTGWGYERGKQEAELYSNAAKNGRLCAQQLGNKAITFSATTDIPAACRAYFSEGEDGTLWAPYTLEPVDAPYRLPSAQTVEANSQGDRWIAAQKPSTGAKDGMKGGMFLWGIGLIILFPPSAKDRP